MKVLLVGNVYGGDAGANFYMIMQKLLHGFARNGHAVQVFNDRETARAATPFRSRKLGIGTANRNLVETCGNFRPDLVLLGHCEMITNDTLARVRDVAPGVRIVYRNVDPIFDANNRKRILDRIDAVDAVFITTAGPGLGDFAHGRAPVRFMPNPVDPAVETLRQFDKPGRTLTTDLFFGISGFIAGGDVRVETVRTLREKVPDIAFEVRGLDAPAVRGAGYFDRLAQTGMGLSFSRVNDHYLYASDRMAQYVGCGLLTFVDRATGFGDLFAEDELGFYDGLDDLAERIRFFTRDDSARRRVAEKGWRRAHAVFDTARVAKYLQEASFEQAYSLDYEWPTAPAIPEESAA